MKVGKELGLDGESLRDFVSTQQKEERQRRAEEREAREVAAAREFELEKLRLESANRRVEVEREVELNRIESQHRIASVSNSTQGSSGDGDNHSRNNKVIKLPFFNEEEDIDVYLNRFERECVTFGVRESEWTIQLARLLRGTALEVYQRMPDDTLDNYQQLKTELLKRFNLSEEG